MAAAQCHIVSNLFKTNALPLINKYPDRGSGPSLSNLLTFYKFLMSGVSKFIENGRFERQSAFDMAYSNKWVAKFFSEENVGLIQSFFEENVG